MGEVTVGIDIGTTAVKAVAADADGNIEDRVRIPHRVLFPAADRMEHDAGEAWLRGPATALAELARPDARAVAVSAMVPSMTAVGADGRPLTPGLLYGDARGRPPGRTAAGDPSQSGEAVEFLRWTAGQAPAAAGFWSAPAVANHALGGAGVIDVATAMTTHPLFTGSAWDDAVCAGCGARSDQMPQVAMMGAAVGRVTDTSAVLAAGSIDALCEQLVAGADQAGDVLVICGTTLIVWVVVPEPRQVAGLWTIPHTAPGLSMMGGASNAGGLFLDWVDRLLVPADLAGAEPDRVPVWSPYLRGERTPLHDPGRRAQLSGLDITHDSAALRRAACESSGFVVRHLLDLAGVTPRRLVATGGGTRVDGWVQALADATGVGVHVAAVPEGAALGAAFLARMAVGLETSMAGGGRWARTSRTVDPDPGWVGPMAERYARFRALAAG